MDAGEARNHMVRFASYAVSGHNGAPIEQVLAGLVDDLKVMGHVQDDRETTEVLDQSRLR